MGPAKAGRGRTAQSARVKGIGEAATIGSTPTIVNAIRNMLAPFGIRHIAIPLTPQKIWHAAYRPWPMGHQR
jgi:CO/xanthine dehydrogenase Mo-binding subunit